MEQMVIAGGSVGASAGGREALIFQQIERALGARGGIDHREVDAFEGRAHNRTGLTRVRSLETLIALGRSAHIGLADFDKRSVFTGDIGLEKPDLDIERLIWASINTSRAVAVGEKAWRSMQALPIEAISIHRTPPLRMATGRNDLCNKTVRMIRHGRQPQAEVAAELLGQAGFTVISSDDRWSDDAAFHVHIGDHGLDSEELRIVDSWNSGRIVIQLDGPREVERRVRSHDLYVENEVNGIRCGSIGEIVAICEEVRADATFWTKLVRAGHKTVAPLLKGWTEIAEAVLA